MSELDSVEDAADVRDSVSALIREPLVAAAVRFLRNPRVLHASPAQHRAFLLQKGLSEAEVQEAFSRGAGAFAAFIAPWRQSRFGYSLHATVRRSGLLGLLHDVCGAILVFCGGGYVVYYAIKNYVLPWLTGLWPRSTADRLSSLQSAVETSGQSVRSDLQLVQSQLTEHQRHLDILMTTERRRIGGATGSGDLGDLRRQLAELKAEVVTLKGLMLNRHQFPTAPPPPAALSGPVGIPAWQLPPAGGRAEEEGASTTTPDVAKAGSSSSGDIVLVSGHNSDELSDS